MVNGFCARLDAILPHDRAAADATTDILLALRLAGKPIHGHRRDAIAAGVVLVTDNTRESECVPVWRRKTGRGKLRAQ